MPPAVPRAEWGLRECLRLHLRSPHFHIQSSPIPFGSRLPGVVSNSAGTENEGASGSVYVFDDGDPLVARSTLLGLDAARRQRPDDSDSEGTTVTDNNALRPLPVTAVDGVTAVVEDIEKVLPGAVDLECAAVPYVAYRFPLPFSSGTAGSQDAPVIGRATMSMTGFTVEVSTHGS